MILEYCQLLSTAWHVLDHKQAQYLNIYKKTHVNHPCAIWVRQHINNYLYVAQLALALCDEWRKRYNHIKKHGCEDKLNFLLNNIPPNIPKHVIVKNKHNPKCFSLPMPLAMPDELKCKKNKCSCLCHFLQKLLYI
jgi:hypothetical protein